MITNLEEKVNEFSKTSAWRRIGVDGMYLEQNPTKLIKCSL